MHSFYIEPPVDGQAALLPEESRHALKVLRLRPGDELCAMDGDGRRWRAELLYGGEDGAVARLLEELDGHEPPVRVTVYQGVPKADKLDLIVQKLTELGAARLTPVKLERCVVKLNARDGQKRLERLERIAREAAKQCNRGRAPAVDAPIGWAELLERLPKHELVLAPWEEAAGRRMKDAFAEAPGARDIAVVIGPEGGMTPAEVAAMEAAGARTVTLGPRILRTETAAVTAAALAMALWGDL